jgi:hypothetical protein
MEKTTRHEIIENVIAGVAGLAVCGAILAGPTRDWADNGFAYERRAVERLHERLEDAKDDHIEATHTQIRHEQNLGEACMAMLGPYLVGGNLEGTVENDVVDDVDNGDTDACGQSRTEIRGAYKDTLKFRDEATKAERNVQLVKDELGQDIDNTELWWDVQAVAKWGTGGVGAIVLGGAVFAGGYEAVHSMFNRKAKQNKKARR